MTKPGTGSQPIPFPRERRSTRLRASNLSGRTSSPLPPHNLPTVLTPFMGRHEQVREVAGLLIEENVRLLSLTRAGGVGKTRLALRVAEEVLPDFEDGVCFVALAPLSDPELVVPTIAQSLGVMELAGTAITETLSDYQVSMAKGIAEIVSNRDNNRRVKIGSTRLRLATESQLRAFQPGIEYRVYYLAGPVPNILSAEVVNAGIMEAEVVDAAGSEEQIEQDPVLRVSRGARLVLIILGLLVLEIPIAAIWSGSLPEGGRWVVIFVLLVEALGFTGFALWRLLARS